MKALARRFRRPPLAKRWSRARAEVALSFVECFPSRKQLRRTLRVPTGSWLRDFSRLSESESNGPSWLFEPDDEILGRHFP
jgi:hypothetical protein